MTTTKPISPTIAVLASSVLCAVLACDGASTGAEPDAGPNVTGCVVDLNYNLPTSTPLTPGTEVETVLCPARDQDLYRFNVPQARTIVKVELAMDTNITELQPGYAILRDDGTDVGAPTGFVGAANLSAGQAPAVVGTHLLLEAGDYILSVRDATALDGGFDVANAVRAKVTLIPEPDTLEPNNTPALATLVTTPTVAGQIATSGDVDVFAVDVRAGNQGLLEVVFDAPASDANGGVDHVVSVLESDGNTPIGAVVASTAAPTPAGRQGVRARYAVVGGTRVYIQVAATSGDDAELDAARGAYSLSLAITDDPDANERTTGNDVFPAATAVSTGTDLQASIASLGDTDVYAVTVTASRAQPQVLITTIEVNGDDTFTPQVTIIGEDPEAQGNQGVCNTSCPTCANGRCLEPRMQRFVPINPFRIGFPLRGELVTYVVVNDFNDDAYQDGNYRIRFEVVDDPDAGEAGDDYLIANLESAGYANEDELRDQFRESRERARPSNEVFPLVCGEEGADPTTCLPLVAVPSPTDIHSDEEQQVVNCASAPDGNFTLEGRLSYEGDRDYFMLDVPSRGYWGLDVNYEATGVGSTPVELTVFIHAENNLIMSFLESEPIENQNCQSTSECPAGHLCIDRRCWADTQSNPSFTGRTFPTGDDCSLVDVIDRRPVMVEVTDNGINDFDPDLRYRLNVSLRCGCPTACDDAYGSGTRCQGIGPP
jgi:hypothetical protein